MSSEWIDLAHRLAKGARAQALRDQRRYNAIMDLPLHVYHVANRGSYESILHCGLLSSRALCTLVGASDSRALLMTQRTKCIRLNESILLRDQKPMPPSRLSTCLVNISPADWYELLNGFVFFWFDLRKAEQIRSKYKDSMILKFDFRKLLFDHEDRAYLTPINTGSASYDSALRSPATFVPWIEWTETRWASEEMARGRTRKRSPKPVEFAIEGQVNNVSRYLVHDALICTEEFASH